MNRDKKLREITQHVWDFIYFKIVLTSEPPLIEATHDGSNAEMIELLRMVVWTGAYVSLSEWRGFLYDHYVRMTSSPKSFATYVLYALHTTKQTSEQNNLDAFQIFLSTMSLVVQLALYSNEDRQAELLPMSQEIFIEFFEMNLKKGFNKQGGWKALIVYLKEKKPRPLFKKLQRWEEAKCTPRQIVKTLEKVNSSRDHKQGSKLLREHLSKGIKSSKVEGYKLSSRILNSLAFLRETKCDKFDSYNTSNPCFTQESPSKSSEQKSNPATESEVNVKHPKEVFQQANAKPHGRITTREVYLRAKSLIEELRFDFHKLEELWDFVSGDASVIS